MKTMMTPDQIKVGMVFDLPDKTQYKVIEEGDYKLENGKRVEIDNRRKNKWWCQKVDSDKLPELFCFDLIFDNEESLHFRED